MASITFKGFEKYGTVITQLYKETPKILGRVTYEGAGIIADEIRKGIEGLPIVDGFGTAENPLPGGVTKTQKAGLLDGFGISGLQDDNGFINVKLGFDDYNGTRTKTYPQGQPNALVARGVESGTSWKKKHPFVRPAVTRARKKAEEKMAEVLGYEIAKLME